MLLTRSRKRIESISNPHDVGELCHSRVWLARPSNYFRADERHSSICYLGELQEISDVYSLMQEPRDFVIRKWHLRLHLRLHLHLHLLCKMTQSVKVEFRASSELQKMSFALVGRRTSQPLMLNHGPQRYLTFCNIQAGHCSGPFVGSVSTAMATRLKARRSTTYTHPLYSLHSQSTARRVFLKLTMYVPRWCASSLEDTECVHHPLKR